MVIAKESFQDFFNMIVNMTSIVLRDCGESRCLIHSIRSITILSITKSSLAESVESSLSRLDFYIKCEEKDKIKHLFELYDLKKAGGIMKEEF